MIPVLLAYGEEKLIVDCLVCGLTIETDLSQSVAKVLAKHRHSVQQHDFYKAFKGSTVPALPPPRQNSG